MSYNLVFCMLKVALAWKNAPPPVVAMAAPHTSKSEPGNFFHKSPSCNCNCDAARMEALVAIELAGYFGGKWEMRPPWYNLDPPWRTGLRLFCELWVGQARHSGCQLVPTGTSLERKWKCFCAQSLLFTCSFQSYLVYDEIGRRKFSTDMIFL